jgi:L-fucose isomerase-like protein
LVGLAGKFEVGFENTPRILERARQHLMINGLGVTPVKEVMVDDSTVAKAAETLKNSKFDLICVCVGTWSEDHLLLDLLDYYDVPVILWAFPAIDTGSLCGVQQICCVLKELSRRYFYVYGQPEDLGVLQEIGEISRAAALENRLKHVKIGTIGGRVKGMADIAFDELEIKDRTGVRILGLDEDELASAYDKADAAAALKHWNDIKQQAGHVTSTDEHGTESLRYYAAIKSLIQEYSLEGICVKCYPKLMGRVCLAYSLLSEEGVVCGCEGDVNGTVAMKILYELTQKPIHNTDLLYPDQDTNTILFSHCGSGGFSIASGKQEIVLGPVRLAETGVAAMFPAKPGKVTLVNIVGRKGTYRMSVLTGDAVKCGMEFPGNPLKVKFDRDLPDLNRQIAYEGIGHHWMGGYGDVSRKLEIFCGLRGIRFLKL